MAGRQLTLDGQALALVVTCTFEDKRSAAKRAADGSFWHRTTPDSDNCLKFVMDAISIPPKKRMKSIPNGQLISNDSHIAIACCRKVYGAVASTHINLRQLRKNAGPSNCGAVDGCDGDM